MNIYAFKFCTGLGFILKHQVTPKYASSCNDINLEVFEECYSNVIGKKADAIYTECMATLRQNTGTVNIVITILAESNEARRSIIDALNDDNFVDEINEELGDDPTNHIRSADPPTVLSTGNLIQCQFYHCNIENPK